MKKIILLLITQICVSLPTLATLHIDNYLSADFYDTKNFFKSGDIVQFSGCVITQELNSYSYLLECARSYYPYTTTMINLKTITANKFEVGQYPFFFASFINKTNYTTVNDTTETVLIFEEITDKRKIEKILNDEPVVPSYLEITEENTDHYQTTEQPTTKIGKFLKWFLGE